MKTLFVITEISDTFIELIIHERRRNQVTVVTTLPETAQKLQELDIDSFLLRQKNMSVPEKDRLFAKHMMPGIMSEYGNFNDSDLQVWEVLSLDRLKFWFDHTADTNASFIDGFDADKIYVTLDMDSPYPWLFEYLGVYVIGVQTKPIRTPEFVLFSTLLDFTEYIVLSEEDEEFLKKINIQGKITNAEKNLKDGRKITDNQERESLKSKMGLSGKVCGVFFDKRDEWQTRKFLSELSNCQVIVFPTDARSKELIDTVLYNFSFLVHTSPISILACDEIVSFRWDDNYFPEDLPDTFRIVDYNGFNQAAFLAPEGVDVTT